MIARLGIAIGSAAVAMAVAVAVATTGRAEITDQSMQTATARERPRGVVLDCSTQSGLGGAPGGTFTSRWNLVVGPLAMRGAGGTPVYYANDFGGQKFPLTMRGGHRVTLEVSRRNLQGTRLIYGRRPARVITFISCRSDEMPPRNPTSHTLPVASRSGQEVFSPPRPGACICSPGWTMSAHPAAPSSASAYLTAGNAHPDGLRPA